MSSNVSSLSSLLLNPYAQQSALNVLQPTGSPLDSLKPGANVTARYTVGEDGDLVLREVNLEAEQQSGGKGKQLATNEDAPRRSGSFADISPAKASISPSDEVALFAATDEAGTQLLPEPANNNQPNVFLAQYEEIGKAPAPELKTVAEQKQQNVANLYARNLDITYNITPAYSEAA